MGISASSSDAVSKLEATMVKISSQVDSIPREFEKILEKTLISNRPQSTEVKKSNTTIPSKTSNDETAKGYESRIKSLGFLTC